VIEGKSEGMEDGQLVILIEGDSLGIDVDDGWLLG